MSEDSLWLTGLLLATLRGATPLIFAALGGVLSERAGIVQIALEGFLLIGALAAALVALATGNPWLGLASAGAASMLLAGLMALLVIVFRADGIIAGTAINLLVMGLCPFVTKLVHGSTGSTPNLDLSARFTWEPIGLAFVAVAVTHLLLEKTRWGLWLRFAGEAPKALVSAGISARKVRWSALTLAGLCAGLGGAALSTFLASSYAPNMSAGRGFMALAAVILGGWRPIPAALACLGFAFFDALQIYLQMTDWGLPVQLIQSLPYAVTIITLIIGLGKSRAPKALGVSA